jgi:hypothetical protein
MFSNFFRKSCGVWDNVEKYGRARQATDNNIIGRMRFACWMTKAMDTHTHTHTHKICNTYCFSTTTVVTGTRLNVTFIRMLSLSLHPEGGLFLTLKSLVGVRCSRYKLRYELWRSYSPFPCCGQVQLQGMSPLVHSLPIRTVVYIATAF